MATKLYPGIAGEVDSSGAWTIILKVARTRENI